MITIEELERLRAQRNQLRIKSEFTPNNTRFSYIAHTQDIERENAIRAGEYSMDAASKKLNEHIAKSFHEGRAKAEFNQTQNQEIKP